MSMASELALIIGGTSGIGKETAKHLVTQAIPVWVTGRDATKLEEVKNVLGKGTEGTALDLLDIAYVYDFISHIEQEKRHIKYLVNAAGTFSPKPFLEMTGKDYDQYMDLNKAFFLITQAVAKNMKAHGGGSIVNIGSILGHRGIPFNSEYCASKFALRGFSEALRAELVGIGIDVLMVSPGSTETELFDHLLEQHGQLPWSSQRRVSPDRVARATVTAIGRGRHEVVPSWRGPLLVWLNRLAPWLVDRLMARYGK